MPLPDWTHPLYDADEMRACDAWAIEERQVPSLDLMERAGIGLARVVAARAGRGPIRVVVGKGNNGGDGLVAARHLRAEGREVDVLAIAPPEEIQGDAAANLERLGGEAPRQFCAEALEGSGAVVDALLGTGFEGSPREPAAGAITAMNECDSVVIACDVPSGVNASTGEIEGEAVRATATATFHGPKIGLHVAPGAFHAGMVETIEIGIPRGAPAPSTAGLIGEGALAGVPHRERDGSKFTSGVVLVAGGASGTTGAPTMAALSAQRAGAGYVQAAVPESAQAVVAMRLLEGMPHALPEKDGGHVKEGAAQVVELAERAGAVVLGPGLGRTKGAFAFARRVAREVDVALLIDADGLNAHAGRLADLRNREAPTVLTPHEGELARLLERDKHEIAAHRLASAREAAELSGAIVLLKGDDTLVVDPAGPVCVSPGGTPALATAGTGDVLSGLIGTLLAKGLDPLHAACAGTVAHVRAARVAARGRGADHVIAGDVIDALPEGMRRD